MYFEEDYREYRKAEKLTMITTISMNNLLKSISFGMSILVCIIEKKDDQLEIYTWRDGSEIGCRTIDLDKSLTYSDEGIAYVIDKYFAKNEEENEDEPESNRIPMARTKKIGTIDGNDIYIIPVSYTSAYPKGLLWQKAYEVFAERWEEILEKKEINPIFDYSDPESAEKDIFTPYNWTVLSCCRALSVGGFNTGTGNPYESENLFSIISSISSMNYEKRKSKGIIVGVSNIQENEYKDYILIKLKYPLPIHEQLSKAYRKIIETTSGDIALAFGEETIIGLLNASSFK